VENGTDRLIVYSVVPLLTIAVAVPDELTPLKLNIIEQKPLNSVMLIPKGEAGGSTICQLPATSISVLELA
jgi:hypothetical protein